MITIMNVIKYKHSRSGKWRQNLKTLHDCSIVDTVDSCSMLVAYIMFYISTTMDNYYTHLKFSNNKHGEK